MKRRTALPALLLAICLLADCAGSPAHRAYDYGGLTLTLSAEFVDLSDQEYAKDFTFLYGSKDLSVLGLESSKESLHVRLPDLSLREYAGLMIQQNELQCRLQEKDGLYFIEYNSVIDSTGGAYSYLAAFYETGTSYWAVQTYCPAEAYANNRAAMWALLCAVITK